VRARREFFISGVNLQAAEAGKQKIGALHLGQHLLHDPELLFLDEPTTGLDPVNARLIKELIEEQRSAGKTVFLTTHNMTVADELCDRVGFIIDGEVALIDAPRDLRLRYGRRVVRVEYQTAGRMVTREFPVETLGDDAEFIALLRGGKVQIIHTLEAQVITPLRTWEYLVSKVGTLTLLGLVENTVIVMLLVGLGFNLLPLAASLVLTAALYCLAGVSRLLGIIRSANT
jgi:AAA domain, putative AbiEii toxin, Type IV TA system